MSLTIGSPERPKGPQGLDRNAEYALRIESLSKAFGGTQALDSVSFDVRPGSIHALLGGNGSGKSTTIKILAGVYEADAGRVEIGGAWHDARDLSVALAAEAGLCFVHQQDSTFPDLTVAENLAIGRGFETAAGGRISWRAVRRHTREVCERFNINCSPDQTLAELSPACRTMIAIARALQDQETSRDALLVLDEPTASLPRSEVDLLLSALERYAAEGQAILYVTHRLDEAVQVADRATVLRDGRVAGAAEGAELDHDRLVRLIMGSELETSLDSAHAGRRGPVVLAARGLTGGSVQDADLALRAGEITGVAGIVGSGRSTLLRLLFGAVPAVSGSVELHGVAVRFADPHEAIAAGVAYVPEDRIRDGMFAEMDVLENLGLTTVGRYYRGGRMRHAAERRDARELLDRYRIKAEGTSSSMLSLSGGTQQKVVLARWLRSAPRVLLLDEPTQGVDVGARMEIWRLVRTAVEAGSTALVVSSDFEEVARVCDRALVLSGGRITCELAGTDLTQARLTETTLMGGRHEPAR